MKISDALHVDTEGIKSCYSVMQSIFHFINIILQQPYFKSTEYDTPIPQVLQEIGAGEVIQWLFVFSL